MKFYNEFYNQIKVPTMFKIFASAYATSSMGYWEIKL